MKKYSLLFALLGILLFSSCNRDSQTEMSEEEAVESIEKFLAEESGGYAKMMEEVVTVYELTNNICNYSLDTTINQSVGQGLTTYNSQSTYSCTLNCDGVTINGLTISSSATRNFDAPRLSATANATTTNSSLTNLLTGTAYTYNGVYMLSGDLSSKINEQAAFNYDFNLTSTDITVDKTTLKITGGTATITFSGGGTSRVEPFSYSGSVVFNGNGTATLVVAGTSYTITIQ